MCYQGVTMCYQGVTLTQRFIKKNLLTLFAAPFIFLKNNNQDTLMYDFKGTFSIYSWHDKEWNFSGNT